MIIIDGKLISDELVSEQFVCNLKACKGACCWEGDYGAPLEKSELKILEEIQEQISPFLTDEGKKAILAQGPYVYVEDAESYATTLIENRACAYMTYDEKGIAQCGIEQAQKAGVIDFKKPISCHLYPIRVTKNEIVDFESLNYSRWDICSAACELGKSLKMPVYKFLKEAIIRKYGKAFYEELDAAANRNDETR